MECVNNLDTYNFASLMIFVLDSIVDFEAKGEVFDLPSLKKVYEPMIAFANNTGIAVLLGKY